MRLAVRSAPVLFLLALSLACSGDRGPEGTPPAARLETALRHAAAVSDSLLEADRVPGAEAERHRRLLRAEGRLRRRDPSPDEVAAFLADWRADPTDLRCLDVAVVCRAALADSAAWRELLDAAAGAGAGSAPALFLAARGDDPGDSGNLAAMRALEAEVDGLERGEAVFLQLRLADLESGEGEHRGAAARRLAAMPELHRLGGHAHAGRGWYDAAMDLLGCDDLDLADAAADMLSRCAHAAGSTGLAFRTTYARACILDRRTRYAAALDSFADLEVRAQERSWYAWQSRAIARQALVERARGDLEASLRHVVRSRDLAASAGRRDHVAARHTVIAGMHRALGRLDSARVHLSIAADLAGELGDVRATTLVDLERQLYALQVGEYGLADSLATDLLSRPEIRDDPALVRDLKLDLMTFGLENDRPDLAYRSLEHLRSQGGFGRISTDYDARLWLALRAAELYARQGEFADAAAELDSVAVLVAAGVGAPDAWLVEQTRGRIAELMGDLATAESRYGAALGIGLEMGNPDRSRRSRVGLGQVLLDVGRNREALELFAAGLDAPEFHTRFTAALFTGRAHAAAGRHGEALRAYARARSMISPDVSSSLRERVAVAEAFSLAASGRPEEAWRRLAEAPMPVTRVREVDRSEVLRAFHRGVERRRAELSIGLLHDHPALAPGGDAADASLRIDDAVRKSAGCADAAEGDGPPAVRDGDLVLRFFLGRERGFAWAGTSAGWRLRELPDLDGLKRLARDVTSDMARPGRDVAWNDARRLAMELLGPDLAGWRAGGTLTLSADGVLHDLPWPALPLPGGEGQLLDRGPLRHASPCPGRMTDATGAPASGRLLAIGADGYGSDGEVRLREAAREAREVASLFPAGSADVLTDAAADWDAVRDMPLAAYGVLHVATHARASLGRRGGSTLRLSAGGRDRPVTADELRGIPLRADLVYLSCCEGASLAADHGSGVDSLARTFIQAGAQAVVASAVATDDEASRLAAGRFYRAWLSGADPASALRSAQLALRDAGPRYAHPFWWAFLRVLVRDGRTGG